MPRVTCETSMAENPLKQLTDRIRDQCLRRVKEGRREALASLRSREVGRTPLDERGSGDADLVAAAPLRERARVLLEETFFSEVSRGGYGSSTSSFSADKATDGKQLAAAMGIESGASTSAGLLGATSNPTSRRWSGPVMFDDFEISESDWASALVSVEDALLLELQAQDDELAAEVEQEYEARQQHEEDDLSSALEALAVDESAPSRDRTLLCPVCQHGWMVASPDGLRLVCSCGARLNLGEDQISLEQIQAELAATFDEHRAHARDAAGMSEGSEGGNSSAHACERPVFTVQNNFFGVSALLANCEHCGFCRVVI